MAVTAYSNYNFGPNYMRYIGIMNSGTVNNAVPAASRVLEGAGNSRAMMTTLNIWYTHDGFLLPQKLSNKSRFQPIAVVAMKDFEALNVSGSYFEADFYMTKPYSTRALMLKLNDLLAAE